ncbi:winged helix DNA-binding protein [Propionibacteriaceae bacterium ES.041]|uniref:DNA glycosylase AlkZ-like family protein n=1 Tax=Enemella evansiae TaxID=2016499 RepID=UPI000B96F29C|nr:crosslink repair DNA glycosylase YcaQ family protein [Enemella evansiae]OYO07359.1 hypothetical protein CGZ98_17965 [Enemella evansiae]PFG67407.1 winged helix DNA-binding protein [Propionibacteriaceae bacterium ES.041]
MRGLDGRRVLGWRLARQGLGERLDATASEVVESVVALRGWPAAQAELAVAVRQARPEPAAVARALDAGELIRGYAFRGGSYVFTHRVAADLLALHTATRSWEGDRFQRQADFSLPDWEPFRQAIREALADGPRTRAEIAAFLVGHSPAMARLSKAAGGAAADALYKPLHWLGDISFGPDRGQQATFQLLAGADPRWPGLPELDEAGPRAIEGYLAAYAPATRDNLHYRLTDGLGVPKRMVTGWLDGLVTGGAVCEVLVDGVTAYARTADLDALTSAAPASSVRLLPGFDPWVMGPGTTDQRIISSDRRPVATRGANLILNAGVVSGSWLVRRGVLEATWFTEAGPVPGRELADEVERLAGIRGEELELVVETG